MVDHLCDECKLHFKEVLEFLDEVGLPYYLNPYLVRGLDYYTKTVFEITEGNEDGSRQETLIAGGRYDNLVKLLGGKDTPACGGAIGVERVMSAMKNNGIILPSSSSPDIYLAQLGVLAKRRSLKLLEDLRTARIPVSESFNKDSLRTQLGIASKTGVKYALIFGQQEALQDLIIIRDMKTGKQETVELASVAKEIKKRLKKH